LFHAKYAKVIAKGAKEEKMHENEISYKIIGAAIKTHKAIGPGLLESAYEHALAYELQEMGFCVQQQFPLPFIYKTIQLEVGYRLDLLVERKVIVEIKSVEALQPVHFAQLLTYLRLSDVKLGLLINFNSFPLKGNIHRVVNNL
jgi:GxxExxY protein